MGKAVTVTIQVEDHYFVNTFHLSPEAARALIWGGVVEIQLSGYHPITGFISQCSATVKQKGYDPLTGESL